MSIQTIIHEAVEQIAFGTDIRGRQYVDLADLRAKVPDIEKKIVEFLIEKYGDYNDGCGCCMDKVLKEEIIKNLTS
jgi:hypothetical protein